MVKKRRLGNAGKLAIAVVLLLVMVVGLSYGSILRQMDLAAQEHDHGDPESALKRYEAVEQRLQSVGMLRYIPVRDRQNLILNQARLLYKLKRYDEAIEHMDRESDMAGGTTDGRFLVLRADINFRKTVATFFAGDMKDPRALEEALLGIEDNLRDALKLSPDDWDAKFNLEFIDYLREQMFKKGGEGNVKIMEEKQLQQKPQLRPEQMQ